MMIKAIVEMPMGTKYKYEVKEGQISIDRVLQVATPANYGFVPNTLAEDGDALDIFVMSQEPIAPNTLVEVEVMGYIHSIDGKNIDHKLFGVIKGESQEDRSVLAIRSFLNTYKKGFVATEIVFGDMSEMVAKYSKAFEDEKSESN